MDLDELMVGITEYISTLKTDDEKIQVLNDVRKKLHKISPMRNEPVDCIQWVTSEKIEANDYNPNSVAPPEMELLRLSIAEDGYTQPIVTFQVNGHREVVDGFHRNRVGKECPEIQARIKGYLPVVTINEWRAELNYHFLPSSK